MQAGSSLSQLQTRCAWRYFSAIWIGVRLKPLHWHFRSTPIGFFSTNARTRRVAKSLGLQVTGVLGILLQARLKGQLPSLREAMDQLRDLADFRIGAALYAELLQAADEGEAD
jgi:Domain of unknown function (DUF3368)